MKAYRKRKAGLRQTLAAFSHGFLRTRQIYVRSRSDVQFVTVSPLAQICLLFACLSGLFWSAYASVNIVFKDQLLELKQQKLFEARLDYEDQLAQLRAQVEKASDRLLLNQEAYLKKVDDVKSEFDALAEQQRAMESSFRRAWFPAVPEAGAPALKPSGARESSANWFAQHYVMEFTDDAEAAKPISEMRELLSGQHRQHLGLIASAAEFAQQKFERTAALMTSLGLTVPSETLADADAMGGPYEEAANPNSVSRFETDTRQALDVVDGKIAYETAVRNELKRLPLGPPLRNIRRISSEFGTRVDPLRGTMATHGAIDFVAAYGDPVLATAAGRVIWSGLHGPYGNLVEIVHDNGVSTRYGHLKGTNTTTGQRIRQGDVIGWLGNTGRSTGPHLHYETRINDRATDPRNFWRIQNDLQALETDD
jgi:murein DD-endopeptidase MepM/ murein hydrolase activator NlpD